MKCWYMGLTSIHCFVISPGKRKPSTRRDNGSPKKLVWSDKMYMGIYLVGLLGIKFLFLERCRTLNNATPPEKNKFSSCCVHLAPSSGLQHFIATWEAMVVGSHIICQYCERKQISPLPHQRITNSPMVFVPIGRGVETLRFPSIINYHHGPEYCWKHFFGSEIHQHHIQRDGSPRIYGRLPLGGDWIPSCGEK